MRYSLAGRTLQRVSRLRADRRVMLPLAWFQGCRLASQVPGPATPHAPNTSPIATFRTGSAAVALCAGSSWMINGSMGHAAKLEWSRIWKGTSVQAGSFSPPNLPRALHPSSELTMASQMQSGSRSTSYKVHWLPTSVYIDVFCWTISAQKLPSHPFFSVPNTSSTTLLTVHFLLPLSLVGP